MTAFGVLPTSTSPAARRLYEAGRQFAIEKQRKATEVLPCIIPQDEPPNIIEEPVENAPIFSGPTMKAILAEVSAKHKIGVLDILSDRRSRPIVHARQEFMYRAKTETMHSLPVIGKFCRRDHTSVLHGVRAHEERMMGGA